jgi:hypothetical protein
LPRPDDKERRKSAPRKPATRAASPSVRGILPDYIGPDDLSRLNEALQLLFGELREAAELYRSAENGGRDGARRAVGAVAKFLTSFQAVKEEKLQAPLLLLVNALIALDNNLVEPMVKPRSRRGRAPATLARQTVKAAAAYVVRRFQDFGCNRTAACQDVAKQLRELRIKPDRGSGQITARTVREWCDAINADIGRSDFAGWMFDRFIANSPYMAPRKEARQVLFDWLGYCVRQFRASETI